MLKSSPGFITSPLRDWRRGELSTKIMTIVIAQDEPKVQAIELVFSLSLVSPHILYWSTLQPSSSPLSDISQIHRRPSRSSYPTLLTTKFLKMFYIYSCYNLSSLPAPTDKKNPPTKLEAQMVHFIYKRNSRLGNAVEKWAYVFPIIREHIIIGKSTLPDNIVDRLHEIKKQFLGYLRDLCGECVVMYRW